MTPLTPLDIEHAAFRIAMRGYDRNEVEQFRSAVLQAVSEYVNLIGQYKARVGELESQLRHYKDSEELLKNSVMLAQKTGEDLAQAARSQADSIVGQARLEAERIRAGLAELEAQRERFEFEFYGLLSGFMARLQQHNPRLAATGSGSGPGPHAAPLLAELVTEPVRDEAAGSGAGRRSVAPPDAAAPASAAQSASAAAPRPAAALTATTAASISAASAEAQKRDLDIDDFSAALNQARPETAQARLSGAHGGLFSSPPAESWEGVEPDVDEAAADPYAAEEAEWLEEDLGDGSLEHASAAVQLAGDDAAVFEDEALTDDDDEAMYDEDEEVEDEEEYDEEDDEELEELQDEDEEYDEGDNAEGASQEQSAAAQTEAEDAGRHSGLTVHPVDEGEDDDDNTPRVRRTGRW